MQSIGLEDQPISGVTLDRLRISSRPGIAATNVVGLKIFNCDARPQACPVVTLAETQDVVIRILPPPPDAEWLLRLDGDQTQNMRRLLADRNDVRRITCGPSVDLNQLVTE